MWLHKMAYTAGCCSLNAQFIPVGIASVASKASQIILVLVGLKKVRYFGKRPQLASKEWNNSAVSFCLPRVNELKVITADILWILASLHCTSTLYVALAYGFTKLQIISRAVKRDLERVVLIMGHQN